MENTQIKVYQEISYIETFDGEQIAINIPIQWLKERIYNDKEKFIQVGSDFINKSIIKRFYSKKVDEIENAILNIANKEIRDKVKIDIENRKKEGKRINLEILSNVIKKYE